MQTKATVMETKDGFAVVEVERESACEGCHKSKDGKGCSICSLTGASKKFRATAVNRIGATVGERVIVDTDTSRVLGYSVLVFFLPVVVGLASYFISGMLTEAEWLRCLAFVGGFLLSFVCIFFYSRYVAKRRCDLEIVARAIDGGIGEE